MGSRAHRFVLLGNSGSGKSTLALRLASGHDLPHLDLDTVAWQSATETPQRRRIAESARDIESFLEGKHGWIVEGCYADLVAVPLPRCTRFLFLNPGIDACIANALARPWESHKFASKEEQDVNLAFLLDWIRDYPTRGEGDPFGLRAHRALFDGFTGDKMELTTREAIAAFD